MNIVFLFLLFHFSSCIASPMSWFQKFFFGKQYVAAQAYNQCDYEKALTVYHDLMNHDSYNPELNYNVGDVLYKQKKYIDAKQSFLRTIENAEATSKLVEQAYFNVGNCCYQMEEWQQAIDAYERVIKINENNQQAHHNLGLARYKLKDQQLDNESQKNNQQENNENSSEQQEKGENQSQDSQSEKKSQSSNQSDQSDSKNKESSNQADQEQQNMSKNDQEQSETKNGSDQQDRNQTSDSQEKEQGSQSNSSESGKQSDEVDLNSEKSLQDKLQDKDPGKEEGSSSEVSDIGQDDKREQESVSDEVDGKDMRGSYKKPELKNKLQDQYEGKASDDDRLTDYHASVMKTLEDLEEKIQKHVIKNKVAMQGTGQNAKKGW